MTLEDLHAAMQPLDKATNQPRGYTILRPSTFTRSETEQSTLFSLAFDKKSWPGFLQKLRKDGATFAHPIEGILGLLAEDPLRYRGEKHADTDGTARDDLNPSNTSSDYHGRDEARSLLPLLRSTVIWQSIQSQQRSTHLKPFDYTLFLIALLTSSSLPYTLRQQWKDLLPPANILSEHPKLLKEVRFLQEQMASLEKCCSAEEACACAGKGLAGSHCSPAAVQQAS